MSALAKRGSSAVSRCRNAAPADTVAKR